MILDGGELRFNYSFKLLLESRLLVFITFIFRLFLAQVSYWLWVIFNRRVVLLITTIVMITNTTIIRLLLIHHNFDGLCSDCPLILIIIICIILNSDLFAFDLSHIILKLFSVIGIILILMRVSSHVDETSMTQLIDQGCSTNTLLRKQCPCRVGMKTLLSNH